MRLIPVRNSQSDLAEVSELIKVVRSTYYITQIDLTNNVCMYVCMYVIQEAKKHKSHPGESVSLSFFVWLGVVLVIPVLTYQVSYIHTYIHTYMLDSFIITCLIALRGPLAAVHRPTLKTEIKQARFDSLSVAWFPMLSYSGSSDSAATTGMYVYNGRR